MSMLSAAKLVLPNMKNSGTLLKMIERFNPLHIFEKSIQGQRILTTFRSERYGGETYTRLRKVVRKSPTNDGHITNVQFFDNGGKRELTINKGRFQDFYTVKDSNDICSRVGITKGPGEPTLVYTHKTLEGAELRATMFKQDGVLRIEAQTGDKSVSFAGDNIKGARQYTASSEGVIPNTYDLNPDTNMPDYLGDSLKDIWEKYLGRL